MKYLIFFLLLGLLPLQRLQAQNKADNQQKFLQAKNHFKQERWEQAMVGFRELAAIQKNNSFVEYASFYYALSAIETGRLAEARAMLQQIKRKFAGWDKQEEVNFWLTRVYLEEKSYSRALETVEEINNKRIKTDAAEMAEVFLSREKDLERLKNLLKEFPDNDRLAKIIADRISRQPAHIQDQALLQELVQKHKLDKELLSRTQIGASKMKDEYNVAALLPFLYEDLYVESNMHNQYLVLDMYEGMKIAAAELESSGVRLNLQAFDTKRDSVTTRRILNSQEIRGIDLIIGPLYPAPSKLALDFTRKNGVNIVNPLSSTPEVMEDNPYSFLFRPSLITQGEKAAEFASRTFEEKNAMIIYGSRDRDAVLAQSYKASIEEKGFTVSRMIRIPAGEESRIRNLLLPDEDTPDAMLEGGSLNKKTIGHLFVATDEDLIVSNVLNALVARGDGLPVIGQEGWLKKSFVYFDQLEKLGVYFVAPEYIDYASSGYTQFREMYLRKVNNVPSRYAFIGYEVIMYFGKMLHQYGTLFQQGDGQDLFQKGILCTGYSFSQGNDNQCVPIVKFKDSALEIVFQ